MTGDLFSFHHPISPVVASNDLRALFQALLIDKVRLIETREVRLKIPKPVRLMERAAETHFHFKPEIFFQLQGETFFRFPEGELNLQPGDIGILPTGLPHGETVSSGEKPFRNMVIGFYSSSVSMHFAAEIAPGRPGIEKIGFYSTPELQQIIDIAEMLVRFRHRPGEHASLAERGLAISLLSILINILDHEISGDGGASQKIFQLKWLVRDQLYNPDLSVKSLAAQLEYAPEQLSHMFHQETGETLIHYVQRQRVAAATGALLSTVLPISHIASACGFADPGYFSRVFRKITGRTPQSLRDEMDASKRRERRVADLKA